VARIRAEIDRWWGSEVIDVRVPDEQEGTKAVVRAWLKQPGETVALNDPLVELETDKVTQEVPAPAAGVLVEICLAPMPRRCRGAVLGRISVPQPSSFVPTRSRGTSRDASFDFARRRSGEGRNPPFAVRSPRSPSARYRSRPHCRALGRNGRITREDVDRAVEAATVSHVDGGPSRSPSRVSPKRTGRTSRTTSMRRANRRQHAQGRHSRAACHRFVRG
jgi:2-oxoglutarate dehydrogenase E2 component (dihydrolipoamide succinyltransferase)